jgi:hypothetical protein
MADNQQEHKALIDRLQRDGYTVGETRTDADGVVRTAIGDQWMTLEELSRLASQDSEEHDKL